MRSISRRGAEARRKTRRTLKESKPESAETAEIPGLRSRVLARAEGVDPGQARRPVLLIFFLLGRELGAWDHVFVGGPVAEVDDAAAFAAKRKIGVVTSHRFLTDGASHHTATKGEILMNAEAAGGGAVSVGGSSV